jgi:transposase
MAAGACTYSQTIPVEIGDVIKPTLRCNQVATHKSVNHGRGEFARDEDGDGLCEVHVNTMEGFWSLLRSWLRPHRGISQEKLPLYLGFFEFVHNARKRGKALLHALMELLVR